jgi:hypothetical protein
MQTNLIVLWGMPDALMLIVECPSGVRYENQVGGVVCWRGEQEGVLAPVDVQDSTLAAIRSLPYPQGIEGITIEIANSIDALLAGEVAARMIKVDLARMHQSWEAWIYVEIEAPRATVQSLAPEYAGSVYGFGAVRGVLTWINSD